MPWKRLKNFFKKLTRKKPNNIVSRKELYELHAGEGSTSREKKTEAELRKEITESSKGSRVEIITKELIDARKKLYDALGNNLDVFFGNFGIISDDVFFHMSKMLKNIQSSHVASIAINRPGVKGIKLRQFKPSELKSISKTETVKFGGKKSVTFELKVDSNKSVFEIYKTGDSKPFVLDLTPDMISVFFEYGAKRANLDNLLNSQR